MNSAPVVVIGGGISGLAAAVRLAARLGPARVVLLEADTRLGGKIETRREGAYLLESGADCFLAGKPGGIAFCELLGLADRLVPTSPENRGSFVRRDGELHPLPEGFSGLIPSRLLPILRSQLLSPVGRIRLLAETVVPRRRRESDESVASFARRRFGAEAYDWLYEPLLGGIHAGDGELLSLHATFPNLRSAEREHGSLLRNAFRTSALRADRSSGTGFVSLRGGMGELVAAAAERLRSSDVRPGWPVGRIARAPDGWQIDGPGGARLHAAAIVVAVDGAAAADLLGPVDAEAAEQLGAIPHASSAIVTLALPRAAFAVPPRGYGFLSPRAGGGPLVACSFSSNKLPERAPEGEVLVRCFFGRVGDDAVAHEPDAQLIARGCDILHESHGVTASPSLTRVRRWIRALPQYQIGHTQLMSRLRDRLASQPGLACAGAIWQGVGIPDCIESGWRAADAVMATAVGQ